MEIFLFVLIGWLTISWFYILRGKLPLMDNVFLFFCNSIFITSASSVLGLNLQLVIPSQQSNLYIAYLIHRCIIDPVMLLIFMNIYFCAWNAMRRWGGTLILFSLMFAVDFTAEKMNIVKYGSNWVWYYDLIMVAMFMLVSYLFAKGLDKLYVMRAHK